MQPSQHPASDFWIDTSLTLHSDRHIFLMGTPKPKNKSYIKHQ